MENKSDVINKVQAENQGCLCAMCNPDLEEMCIDITMLENKVHRCASILAPGGFLRATYIVGRDRDEWDNLCLSNADGSVHLFVFLPDDKFDLLRTGFGLPDSLLLSFQYIKDEMDMRVKEYDEWLEEEHRCEQGQRCAKADSHLRAIMPQWHKHK